MKKSNTMKRETHIMSVETEGARGATGVSTEGYAASSAPKPHDTCTPIPYVINSFSPLSPSAILRILKHSQSHYTEGDFLVNTTAQLLLFSAA